MPNMIIHFRLTSFFIFFFYRFRRLYSSCTRACLQLSRPHTYKSMQRRAKLSRTTVQQYLTSRPCSDELLKINDLFNTGRMNISISDWHGHRLADMVTRVSQNDTRCCLPSCFPDACIIPLTWMYTQLHLSVCPSVEWEKSEKKNLLQISVICES